MAIWTYNYLSKSAQGTSGLHGVIRYLKKQHIDLMEQDTNFTCGPASIQNLFRLLHKEMPAEENLAHVLRCTPESGTDPANIVGYLKHANIPFGKYDPNKKNVDQLLQSNHVILVMYQDYKDKHSKEEVVKTESSHFAVLVGCDSNFYYLIDPFHPKDSGHSSPLTKIQRQNFLSNWQARSFDGSHVMHNWGLVVAVPVPLE